eukprot:4078560-Prymnesium_polylepis.1
MRTRSVTHSERTTFAPLELPAKSFGAVRMASASPATHNQNRAATQDRMDILPMPVRPPRTRIRTGEASLQQAQGHWERDRSRVANMWLGWGCAYSPRSQF